MTRQEAASLIKARAFASSNEATVYGFTELRQSIDSLAWIFDESPIAIEQELRRILDASQISVLNQANKKLQIAYELIEENE